MQSFKLEVSFQADGSSIFHVLAYRPAEGRISLYREYGAYDRESDTEERWELQAECRFDAYTDALELATDALPSNALFRGVCGRRRWVNFIQLCQVARAQYLDSERPSR